LAVSKKRIRRTPEDAQANILDAAEAIMAKGAGPAALRLQDVARQAGVSHPAILHHFGSREGLVRALNKRTFSKLTDSAVARFSAPGPDGDGVKASFAAFRDGLAQRLVWLLQSPNPPPPSQLDLFERVVDAFQEARRRFAGSGTEPDPTDTRAIIHLATVAALGDALLGARLRNAGAKETAERDAFEQWFTNMLDTYLRARAAKPK
jgi:AcrR family transcriptional regulator